MTPMTKMYQDIMSGLSVYIFFIKNKNNNYPRALVID